jgi:RNA polymerase sigma factor (sigma-70 family)
MTRDSDEKSIQARFPPTRRSAVEAVGSGDPAERARAFDVLVRAYWKPVYAHLRLRWRHAPDDARDLTQDFFARAFEKRFFADYDSSRALFRTYMKTCLDRFATDGVRKERREKRGGGSLRVSLDFDVAEEELAGFAPGAGEPVEASFDAAWARSLVGAAVSALESLCEEQGRRPYFTVFRRYVLQDDEDGPRPSYAALAEELGLSVSNVTNYLAWARREFRALLLEELREVTTSEEEWRSEARLLLGIHV